MQAPQRGRRRRSKGFAGNLASTTRERDSETVRPAARSGDVGRTRPRRNSAVDTTETVRRRRSEWDFADFRPSRRRRLGVRAAADARRNVVAGRVGYRWKGEKSADSTASSTATCDFGGARSARNADGDKHKFDAAARRARQCRRCLQSRPRASVVYNALFGGGARYIRTTRGST